LGFIFEKMKVQAKTNCGKDENYLRYWWHAHWVMWSVFIILFVSLIFSWYGYVFIGSTMRTFGAGMILLRTIKKEREKRKYRARKYK
jgi:choline-glycine betaine transporter